MSGFGWIVILIAALAAIWLASWLIRQARRPKLAPKDVLLVHPFGRLPPPPSVVAATSETELQNAVIIELINGQFENSYPGAQFEGIRQEDANHLVLDIGFDDKSV